MVFKMSLKKYQNQRKNILKNVQVLTNLYGLDSDITILIKDNLCIYGIMNKSKTFYSLNSHKFFHTIVLYQRGLTIGFLSDLSREILSSVNK